MTYKTSIGCRRRANVSARQPGGRSPGTQPTRGPPNCSRAAPSLKKRVRSFLNQFSAAAPTRTQAPDPSIVHASIGAPRNAPERLWQGGFYDPCHLGEWDYAGRAIRQYLDQDEAMRRA